MDRRKKLRRMRPLLIVRNLLDQTRTRRRCLKVEIGGDQLKFRLLVLVFLFS